MFDLPLKEKRSPLQWAPAPQHHAHAADPRTNFPPPDPVPPKCGSRDNCAGIFKPLQPIRGAVPHGRQIGCRGARKSMSWAGEAATARRRGRRADLGKRIVQA